MKIRLIFHAQHGERERSRLGYAFRLFCAVNDHEPIVGDQAYGGSDVEITYSAESALTGPRVRLSSSYRARPVHESAPPPTRYERNGEQTFLITSPESGTEPDWLGEIFEWVSCADEYSRSARDCYGRLPFADTYVGRHGLDPCRPWAAIAMWFLRRAIVAASGRDQQSTNEPHLIANTHDVDMLPGTFRDSLRRVLRNAAITTVVYKRPVAAIHQMARAAAFAANHRHPLAQCERLSAAEQARDARATYFFIASRQGWRDANYDVTLPQFKAFAQRLHESGLEVGSHGSFASLETTAQLRQERALLATTGIAPLGNRQHYLRFTIDRLVQEVEVAGFAYDCSLGWSEQVGFRAGACFAFPPYNFAEERPAMFLELPLIVMDATLAQHRYSADVALQKIASMLAVSARLGPGGSSVLWHPDFFEGVNRPLMFERLYRRMLQIGGNSHQWTSGIEIVRQLAPRYIKVGLLSSEYSMKIPAAPARWLRSRYSFDHEALRGSAETRQYGL